MRNLVLFVATGAGSGYAPVAPGTAGSLVGLALWGVLVAASGASQPVLLAATACVTALGVFCAGRAEQILGREDDGRITVDEVAGMLISLLFLPVRPEVAVAGFALFRIFDIWKPWPVRAAEGLGGGLGVMADDVLAGLYANLAGQLLWRVALPGGLMSLT